MASLEEIETAYQIALDALLRERHPEGYWVGELSTSALSTATAVMALTQVQKATTVHGNFDSLIRCGLQWLADHQNDDGGWGDTVKSFTNISTTMLCRATFRLADGVQDHPQTVQRADQYVEDKYGKTPEEQAEAIRQRYGKDRTFSVPILTTCALAGMVSWKEVPSLPFELACFPQSWFRFLSLQVVSYALPALIAIGQCVYHHRKPWNPISRLIRWMSIGRSLRVLDKIQPSNGGFLEAAPLTSFVTLSLASIGRADHVVVKRAVDFLVRSVREDGSWPIDTNLSTWVTTLSINALASAGDLDKINRLEEVRQWLLDQQYKERHPYTGAEPGAWAWTPLPGGVPDADDTPGAIIALANLANTLQKKVPEVEGPVRHELAFWKGLFSEAGADEAMNPVLQRFEDRFARSEHFGPEVHQGENWLFRLQNRDGGWPTFCRGWGRLPFDKSGSDLTAHALRAITALGNAPDPTGSWQSTRDPNFNQGLTYLKKQQRPDGSWLPLWFGNQHAPDDENPVYGTARVLAAYRDLDIMDSEPACGGISYLLSVQNTDGGWGGAANCPSSIEESALAIEVLLDAPNATDAVNKGLCWLVQQVENGELGNPTPIGFYFAKLWYFEKLYPIIFSVAALGRARTKLAEQQNVD